MANRGPENREGTDQQEILMYICNKCHQPVRFTAEITRFPETGGRTHDGNLTPIDPLECPNGGQHDFSGKFGL